MALQESISRRDEFLAMLSHELRNPLGAILNATYVLDSEQSDDVEKQRAYQVVHRQGRQMAVLMNDLLDVSRITQKKIALHLEPIDLRSTIDSAVEAIQPLLEESRQRIKLHVADEEITIMGSRTRLTQIQVNLLTNASKYSPAGSTIVLTARQDAERAYLEIKDEGIGIPHDMREKIFEIFVQSDESLDRSRGGMGVGLTLVKSLVELHQGTVSVKDNGSGPGSTFVVTFPLTNAKVKNEAQDSGFERAGGNRIVIVEDNDDAGQMLKTLLEFVGMEASIATDGREGLDLIRRLKPDLAILDIGVPSLDGYEIARIIRADSELKNIQLIALTGYGQRSDRNAALEAGFDEHLVKPLDPDHLAEILAARLEPASAPSAEPTETAGS